jgi:hypothetical protein
METSLYNKRYHGYIKASKIYNQNNIGSTLKTFVFELKCLANDHLWSSVNCQS